MSAPSAVLSEAFSPVACFAVLADAGPHIVLRVLAFIAKRGLFPSRCHSVYLSEEKLMSIDVQVTGIESEQALLIAAQIGQVVGVRSVLFSERTQQTATQ